VDETVAGPPAYLVAAARGEHTVFDGIISNPHEVARID
jgi:hypothetical protein